MANERKIFDDTNQIIAAFMKHQTATTVTGMAEVTDLAQRMNKAEDDDANGRLLSDALLNLALVGYVTMKSVEAGLTKVLGPEPFTDKDADEVREALRKRGHNIDDTPKQEGGLDFL